jgi:UDP-N-acetylglucosamine acyltransferase
MKSPWRNVDWNLTWSSTAGRVGDQTHVFPFVSIGLAPQDLKYGASQPQSRSKRNHIREFVTVHRGTAGGGGLTGIGDDCLLLTGASTRCSIGNNVIGERCHTASHVEIADR